MTHAKRRHTWIAVLVALGVTGCNANTFNPSPRNSAEVEKTDSGRPTDDGEGLPGYLTDPEHVAIARQADGSLEVKGEKGQVNNDQGKPELSRVFVWQVPLAEYIRMVDSLDQAVKLTGVLRGSAQAAADGSFVVKFAGASRDPVVIVAEGSLAASEVDIKQRPDGKAVAASVDLSTGDAPEPYVKPVLLWSRDEYDKATTEFRKKVDVEDPFGTATENQAYSVCVMRTLAVRYPFADYGSNNDKYIDLLSLDGTISKCTEESLGVKSDRPNAREPLGRWTKRQVEWEVQHCTKTQMDDPEAEEGLTVARAQGWCECYYNGFAALMRFKTYLTAEQADLDKLYDETPALQACTF